MQHTQSTYFHLDSSYFLISNFSSSCCVGRTSSMTSSHATLAAPVTIGSTPVSSSTNCDCKKLEAREHSLTRKPTRHSHLFRHCAKPQFVSIPRKILPSFSTVFQPVLALFSKPPQFPFCEITSAQSSRLNL